ncbi:MAG: alpha/beta fold hydrolase [Burkholderiales bacterium]|nr:alpha/beta fold hydrolase [Burkholderiales bacterium]
MSATTKPVLLLIPGMLNTAAVWDGVAAALAAEAEVRIADVTTQDSIAAMARDARERIADVPASTPLAVCGFSMGGYTAIEMVAGDTAPGRRPDALALLSTSARPETDEGRAMREKTIAAIGRDFGKVIQGVATFGTAEATHADAALMARILEMMRAVGPEAAIRQNRAIAARTDRREQLVQLAGLPTLVMCGREDRITPPPLSEELAALLPRARLEWIDAAGHMTPMEAAPRVAELLRGLLGQARPAPA